MNCDPSVRLSVFPIRIAARSAVHVSAGVARSCVRVSCMAPMLYHANRNILSNKASCCDFHSFQGGGRRHLGFSKDGKFRSGKGQEGQNASPCKILQRSVKPLLRYGHFSIFQDGGRRHLEFSKSGNFMGGKCQDAQNASPI